MFTQTHFKLTVVVVIVVLLAGCGPQATAPSQAPAPLVESAAPTQSPAPLMELAAPAATQAPLADGPYPSTGGLVPPNDQPYADVFFEDYGVNPFIDTEDDHFSTFAVDVDTASYTVMRRYVGDGYRPPDESVRVEEYVNYFEQGYAPPAEGEGAFAIHLEGAPSLYGGEHYYLARVGLKGYEVPSEMRQDVVLTFVIDVSGSMDMENRLGLVKQALRLLVGQLRPTDRVGIAIYGSRGQALLEHTPVAEADRILQAIDSLYPSGSTYAEEGLQIAYRMAAEAYDPGATNRVILCSDGVANVGNTGPDSIVAQIHDYAGRGIYLTTVGFGMGNYNELLRQSPIGSVDIASSAIH